MKETVTTATKAFILTSKMKAFIAFFSLLLVGGGLYVLADPAGQSIVTAKDPYTLDIQNRAQMINNAVLGVIDAQKTQPAYKLRTTYEDAVFLIRKKNLEAEQENLKLTPDQRTLNQKYKAFLHEAYLVIDDCYSGKRANLTKIKLRAATPT
jgi:hypothetical protein